MKNTQKLLAAIIAALSCLLLAPGIAHAAPFQNQSFEFAQPDNSKVAVIGSGDEFYQHIESKAGYTLTRNSDGWICYADLSNDKSELVATDTVYTGDDSEAPESLDKHLEVTQYSLDEKVQENKEALSKDKTPIKSLMSLNTNEVIGNIKGLTVLVDFSDEPQSISKSEVENYFNQKGYTGFNNNGSIRDFFSDISNNKIDYTNKVIGYYRAKHEKSYYDSTNRGISSIPAGELLDEVQDWIKANNIDVSDVTRKSDGSFYMLNLLYAGIPSAGWSDGLWPHSASHSFLGKLQRYQMSNIGNELTIGLQCHETGHALLDYPDMYKYSTEDGHYGSGISITGYYDLMGSGAYNDNGKNPAPPNPYLRNVVSKFNDVKSLNDVKDGTKVTLSSDDNGNHDVYKWNNISNSKEYYLLENLEGAGRYSSLREKGLMIWHINEDGSNTHPKDKKFEVSYIQADGGSVFNSNENEQVLFNSDINPVINEISSPTATWYDGTYSDLKINELSPADETMDFLKGGTQTTQWWRSKSKLYYITDQNGSKLKGLNKIGSEKYIFDDVTGVIKKGFLKYGDAIYYVGINGKAETGTHEVNGKTYTFNDDGTLQLKDAWVTVDDGKMYYYDHDGRLLTGLAKLDGKTYYFKTDGELATGTVHINGDRYYFGEDHTMQSGWIKLDNTWFYFSDEGPCLTDFEGVKLSVDCKEGKANSEIKFTATPEGGYNDVFTFYYTITNVTTGAVENYGPFFNHTTNEFTWTPKEAGSYKVCVTTDDDHFKEFSQDLTIEVK